LVTGPLVVAQYVRSVYPYERAHEKGMGIVQNDAVNAAALEAKLIADELRALRDPARRRAAHEGEAEEVSVDELLVEEEDLPTTPQDQDAAASLADRLGLDAFDEDSDVKPVVLLSPKRKGNERKSDGAFMSDLERRLLEDGSAGEAANGGGTRTLEADEENVGS
jgi:hypothetical protein